jgi:hypothetical protein
MDKNTNNKQVSFKVDSNVYAVLKVYADLDERSVRSWFERYIKSTFKTEYNSILNNTKPNINSTTNPNINSTTNPDINTTINPASSWTKIEPEVVPTSTGISKTMQDSLDDGSFWGA